MFIAIDGIDGCGKSVQAKLLAEKLPAVLIRDPGSTVVGGIIRKILLDPNSALEDETEFFLYMAARAQMVGEVIVPHIHAGRHIVCDRYASSTIAYQQGIDPAWILQMTPIRPDVLIILNCRAEIAFERLHKGAKTLDRIESRGLDYMKRVESRFMLPEVLELGKRTNIINGELSIDETHEAILSVL